MTHTSTEQPEALRLADDLEMIAPNDCKTLIVNSAADELRRLHARVQELEAELEKAKASVSGLKKRSDDWKWRALNAEASQARVPLSDEAIAEIAERFEATDPTDSFWVEVCRAFEGASAVGITQEKQG